MRVLFLCMATVLGGCAAQPQGVWVNPRVTSEQAQRDWLTCRQYGMQSAQANGLSGNLFVESWIQREAGNCLSNLGYTLQKR
jgi:hypothetical protein